jgi:hypothetical protein
VKAERNGAASVGLLRVAFVGLLAVFLLVRPANLSAQDESMAGADQPGVNEPFVSADIPWLDATAAGADQIPSLADSFAGIDAPALDQPAVGADQPNLDSQVTGADQPSVSVPSAGIDQTAPDENAATPSFDEIAGTPTVEEIAATPGLDEVTSAPQFDDAPSAPKVYDDDADSPVMIVSGVPEGFDELLEPETNVIDVFYNGAFIASAVATYSPGFVVFENPFEIVSGIPDVLDADAVLGALTGQLATNADRLCFSEGEDNCGKLYPDVAGVIFDRANISAEVFLNPTYRATGDLGMAQHLEPTSYDPGFVSNLSGILAGGTDQDQTYNLVNRTLIGSGENYADFNLQYSDASRLIVDEARLVSDQPDWRYAAGIFDNEALESVPQEKILGFSVGTQYDTRMDLDQVSGTPIVLFLPSRSRVEILRDGQLLSSDIYDAGNTPIVTSGLPSGAYDITLRIRDLASNEVTEETRFFSKTRDLPPGDVPSYLFQIGRLIDDSSTGAVRPTVGVITNTTLVRAGYVRRLTGTTGLFADTMASQDQLLFQAGGMLYDNDLRIRGGILATTDADLGFFLRYSDRLENFGASLSVRQIFVGDKTISPDENTFDPFTQSTSQYNATVTYSVPEWETSMSFSANYSTSGGSKSWSFGPQVNVLLYDEDAVNVNWNTSVTQSRAELLAFTRLTLSYRVDNWFYRAQSIYRYSDRSSNGSSDQTSGPEGNMEATWSDRDLWDDDLSVTARASRELNADLFNASSYYQTDTGTLEAQFDRAMDDETTNNYSGSFDFNLVGAENGIAIGGRDAASSGVMVSLDGTASMESPFQVQVNNNFEANIMPGQTVFVPLGSYDAHVVSLIGVGDEFIDIDGGVQEVSLYPGSIANVNFEANRIMPAFGQAIFGNGEPVGNARVDGEGVIGVAVTDRNGYFQMEIDEAGTYTLTSGNMSECAFEIPEMPRDEVYLDLGVIRCGDEQVVDSGELNEG